jgi:hypothetical protein
VAGRSIRSTFFLTVALPAAGLVVLWGIALAATFGAFAGQGLSPPDHPDLATLALSVGGGLIVVIACVLLAGHTGNARCRHSPGRLATGPGGGG